MACSVTKFNARMLAGWQQRNNGHLHNKSSDNQKPYFTVVTFFFSLDATTIQLVTSVFTFFLYQRLTAIQFHICKGSGFFTLQSRCKYFTKVLTTIYSNTTFLVQCRLSFTVCSHTTVRNFYLLVLRSLQNTDDDNSLYCDHYTFPSVFLRAVTTTRMQSQSTFKGPCFLLTI